MWQARPQGIRGVSSQVLRAGSSGRNSTLLRGRSKTPTSAIRISASYKEQARIRMKSQLLGRDSWVESDVSHKPHKPTMCVRNAYQCKECEVVFPMPLRRFPGSSEPLPVAGTEQARASHRHPLQDPVLHQENRRGLPALSQHEGTLLVLSPVWPRGSLSQPGRRRAI